ncbi:MerR family transcriptional regulator [Falsirhodobacter sp. alg1]|uniref:MerR family transcriptional regulator n=1 Tax=Falsirhodobacter sp. alg1 TaxID=1472418 RepID=UPI0007889DF6|nr:MerR family transcriptional regulator [Falsirhodobacter sp. alg1]
MNLTIKQFADTAEVSVETIRFYQRKNLLNTPQPQTGIRRYDEEAVKRLRFIRSAQRTGFTLEEIRKLIELDTCQDRAQAREMAYRRLHALDRQIAEMNEARKMLLTLAERCTHEAPRACPILQAFGH